MIKKIKNNGAIGEGEAAVNILLFYSSRRIASVFTASLLFPPSVRQSVSSIVLVGSLPKLLVLLNLFLADALALARTVQLPSQPKYSLYCLRSSAAVSVFCLLPRTTRNNHHHHHQRTVRQPPHHRHHRHPQHTAAAVVHR